METIEEILDHTKTRMNKSLESLARELSAIRTGRASTALVEYIYVEYYGTSTPINQLSSITIPEARTIMIQPWDKEILRDIEKALLQSDLGISPSTDGDVLRINIPELTEERRKDMVKLVGKKVESGHISVRNIRRDSLESLRSMEKGGDISQDESRRAQENLQKITDMFTNKMGEAGEIKETEVMET